MLPGRPRRPGARGLLLMQYIVITRLVGLSSTSWFVSLICVSCLKISAVGLWAPETANCSLPVTFCWSTILWLQISSRHGAGSRYWKRYLQSPSRWLKSVGGHMLCRVAVVSSTASTTYLISMLGPFSACMVYLREIEAFELFVAGTNHTHPQDILIRNLTSNVKVEVSHGLGEVEGLTRYTSTKINRS